MKKLNLSEGAIDLLSRLGFEYNANRSDDDYLIAMYDVCAEEDDRIAIKVNNALTAGFEYPQGLSDEDLESVHYLDEIFNKLAED